MKRLPYILVILLAIPFIANAALPGDATLTLNTRVNTIFLHGFFSPEIILTKPAGDVTFRHIFGQFTATELLDDMHGTGGFNLGKDEELDYNDIEDFDFGEDKYHIGYYLLYTNIIGNYTVSFAISPFYSELNEFTVPWTLEIDYAGGNTLFGTQAKSFASGGSMGFNIGSSVATHEIFQTGSSAVQKFAALELTMVPSFGGSPYEASLIPAGDDYIATVVATITGP